MKKILTSFLLAGLTLTHLYASDDSKPIETHEEQAILDTFQKNMNEPGAVVFTPPEGWRLADPNALPAHVKVMVVGIGEKDLPPSMTLSVEPYNGTLKQYLKIVKQYNDSHGSEWKDLGTITTDAGEASLSQVDSKTKMGLIREMHLILYKDGRIYILDAAALKDEFPKHYKSFFNAMKSLRINPN